MTFLDRIKELVGDAGGYAQVARDIGVSRPAVSQWVHGKMLPGPHHLRRLAQLRGYEPFQIDQLLAARAREEADRSDRAAEAKPKADPDAKVA